MPNSREYLERNREAINAQRRLRYNADARKKAYETQRTVLLQHLRENKIMCPICTIPYHRYYVRKHLAGRHDLDDTRVEELLSQS